MRRLCLDKSAVRWPSMNKNVKHLWALLHQPWGHVDAADASPQPPVCVTALFFLLAS